MTKDEAPTYFTDKHAQSMTLRDHFAGLAMQALIDNEVVFADVPPEAYRMADAMLKIREALAQPKRSMKVEGPLHVVCQCDKCKAQPEQEPVGKFAKFTDGIWREVTDGSAGVPLYTTPPQRTWVGLTEQEHTELAIECGCLSADWVFYGPALERKIKEKNE